jgi:hypothetical protein
MVNVTGLVWLIAPDVPVTNDRNVVGRSQLRTDDPQPTIFSKYDRSSAASVELKVHLYILLDALMTLALREECSIDVVIPASAEQQIGSSHHDMGGGTRGIHPLLTTCRHAAVRPRFLCSSITLLQSTVGQGRR